MTDAHDERSLAAGLRAGRVEAWRALYDAHAPAMWREVARRLGPGADVADVVQEIFLAAAKSAGDFDPARGTVWLWLWGIGRRQVALHFRKRGRANIADAAAILTWIEGREPDPPASLQHAETADLVRATLAELPCDYEALLTAKYLDGASGEALAAKLGCTHDAVRSKLLRARAAFRDRFAQFADHCAEAAS